MRHEAENEEPEDTKPVDLSRGVIGMRPATLFKVAWSVVGTVVFATVTVTAQLYAIHSQIEEVSRDLRARTSDRWTLSMEREEQSKLQRLNPMFVPADVDEIWNRVKPWEPR